MIRKPKIEFLFAIVFLLVISQSHSCRGKQGRGGVKRPARDSDRLLFDPDQDVQLPSGPRQQVNCTGDCDDDAYKVILCEGSYKDKTYTCSLEDALPGYTLEKYEVFCLENFPVKSENCYIDIEIKKTPLDWLFDSRNQIEDPLNPGNLIEQVQCFGTYCKSIDNKIVKCSGIYAKLDYTCKLENNLPNDQELKDYSITCKNFRVRTNDDCYITIQISQKQSAELDDPVGKRLKKFLYGIFGFLAASIFYGILFFIYTRS